MHDGTPAPSSDAASSAGNSWFEENQTLIYVVMAGAILCFCIGCCLVVMKRRNKKDRNIMKDDDKRAPLLMQHDHDADITIVDGDETTKQKAFHALELFDIKDKPSLVQNVDPNFHSLTFVYFQIC